MLKISISNYSETESGGNQQQSEDQMLSFNPEVNELDAKLYKNIVDENYLMESREARLFSFEQNPSSESDGDDDDE